MSKWDTDAGMVTIRNSEANIQIFPSYEKLFPNKLFEINFKVQTNKMPQLQEPAWSMVVFPKPKIHLKST